MAEKESKKEIEDDSSSDSEVEERLKTTEEEKEGTVPYSPQADAAAYATGTAQGNPTVERGLPKKKKKKKKDKEKDKPGEKKDKQ